MEEINQYLNQLPDFLRGEVMGHAGHYSGLSPVDLAARFKWAGEHTVATKQPLMYTHTRNIVTTPGNLMPPAPLGAALEMWHNFLKGEFAGLHTPEALAELQHNVALESTWRLNSYIQAMQGVLARRQQEVAQRLEQETRRKLEEARRQAEEEAASQLALQEAETATREMVRRKEQEQTALQARALLQACVPGITPVEAEDRTPVLEDKPVQFVLNPSAAESVGAAIDVLQNEIDAVLLRFAAATQPYLLAASQAD